MTFKLFEVFNLIRCTAFTHFNALEVVGKYFKVLMWELPRIIVKGLHIYYENKEKNKEEQRT